MRLFLRCMMLMAALAFLLPPTQPALANPGVQPLDLVPGDGPAATPDGVQQPKAAAWYDSQIVYSTITNCVSIIQGFPYQENGMGTYVGFAADPNTAQPGPGQVYYAHLVIAGLGNACSGQRAFADIQLPANTSLAISAANPVKCFAGGAPLNPPSDCPQTLPPSAFNPGAYSIYSTDAAHNYTWPVPQGAMWEFHIPLVSGTVLTNSPFRANVLALDGNSSPWLRPQVGVYVFSNSPSVLYPSPSTTINPGPPATYLSKAWVYTFGLGGSAYFELGSTPGSLTLFSDYAAVPAGGSAWELSSDWTPYVLAANTTYYWRLRFVGSNAQTYTGEVQSFTTPPSGQAVVGSGTAGSCTGSAFNTALATPGLKEVSFNCGSLPVTITLTSSATLSSTVTLDGKNLVTLSGNNAYRHFNLQSGANLTLKNITLSNGYVNGCGGSVNVQAGGSLTTSYATFKNNQSTANGGAICVASSGTASLDRSLLTGNTTGGSGGALYNQGVTELRWSDVSGNSAQGNGGGLWNSYILDFFYSLASGNSVPLNGSSSGGGIYNSYGLTVSTSTIAGNTASAGGGIYSQVTTSGAQAYLINATIAANTSGNAGSAGGLESLGSYASMVRNTLVGNNSPGNCGTNPGRVIFSQGNNLDSGTQCNFTAPGDKINVNPRLGTLSFNGGFNRTVPLQYGSPAIDAADNVYCGQFDQRGFFGTVQDILLRPVDGDGNGVATCDIGAFEYFPQIFLPMVRR